MIIKGSNRYFNDRKELREFLDERGLKNIEIPFEQNWEDEGFLESWGIQYCIEVRNDEIIWGAVEFPYNHYATPSPFYDVENKNTSKLVDVYSFKEAADRWGLDDSTLRKLIKTKKVQRGIDFKRSGSTYLITRDCMERVYGEIKLPERSEKIEFIERIFLEEAKDSLKCGEYILDVSEIIDVMNDENVEKKHLDTIKNDILKYFKLKKYKINGNTISK